MTLCTCDPSALCAACLKLELHHKRGQARVLGSQWAGQVARDPAHRAHEAWPRDDRALAIARRKVAQLGRDPRLVDELALACVEGASEWWSRRPAMYRA